MESIKQAASNLMGSGDKTQSGQEPVSGQTGSGTVNEPYDQGNQYDDPSKFGASAEEHRRSTIPEIPVPVPKLHPASGNHGPHPTFAGNMLDPRTGPAAYEETFGAGAPKLLPKSDKYVLGGASTGYGGIEYSTTGSVERTGSGVGTGSTAAPVGGYESSPATTGSYESSTAPTGGYESTAVPSGGSGSSGAPVGGYDSPGASLGGYGSTGGQSTGGYDRTDRSMSGVGPTDTSSSNLGPSGRTGLSAPGGDDSGFSRDSNTLGGSTTSGTTGGGIAPQGQPRPEHETDKTGVTSMHSNDPHGSDVIPSERNEDRKNVNAGGFGVAEPSVGADPMSAQKPEQKQQGGDRPMEEPTGSEASAVAEKKDEAEEALKRRDPDDHSGEPMKVHGAPEDEGEDPNRSKSMGQQGGGEYGKEYGTGEKYVKSTGLAAEGGDFDATNPGAGREATRLMEQGGISKTSASNVGTTGTADDSSSKGGVGSKIKSLLGTGSSS